MPMWLQGIFLRSDRLQAILYRFICPGGNGRVSKCIACGECGCDNLNPLTGKRVYFPLTK